MALLGCILAGCLSERMSQWLLTLERYSLGQELLTYNTVFSLLECFMHLPYLPGSANNENNSQYIYKTYYIPDTVSFNLHNSPKEVLLLPPSILKMGRYS